MLSNASAMKLIFGAQPFLEAQQADSRTNRKISAQIHAFQAGGYC
jgi:hypothetical protein